MHTAPDQKAPHVDGGPRRRLLLWASVVAAVAVATVTIVAVSLWPAGQHSPVKGPFVDAAAAAWAAHPVKRTAAGTEVHVVSGTPSCIDDWHGGPTGNYSFDVLNDEGDDMEIYLQDTRSKKIYLEVENFGINATRQVTGVIPPGTYKWVCITAYTIKSSKPIAVTGNTGGGGAGTTAVNGIVPVTPLDLRIPINQYTAWVQSQLPTLSRQVTQLAADLHAGDVGAAKRDWLTAHLSYEKLGAAYGAFGKLGDAINGDPPSDAAAVTSPHLTGFRKIEALLWAGEPPAEIAPYADALIANVGKLPAELAKPNSITPLDMGIRAHEILEDTLGKDLNGIGDAGSHTELATVDANITGTFHALQPLVPLLTAQDPWLGRTQSWLRQTQVLVESYHHANGWVPLTSLTAVQRAELNAHVQQAVELLSHIPPITEPRDSPDEGRGIGNDSSGATGGNGK
ncbi:imelysin family protein [Streptomyces sp. NPDC001276]|uniref:imelysin family protein n=1 Tax=Streptomyces sp. NPDC001276 TaxID=3364555 RepID=UPI0036B87995